MDYVFDYFSPEGTVLLVNEPKTAGRQKITNGFIAGRIVSVPYYSTTSSVATLLLITLLTV